MFDNLHHSISEHRSYSSSLLESRMTRDSVSSHHSSEGRDKSGIEVGLLSTQQQQVGAPLFTDC